MREKQANKYTRSFYKPASAVNCVIYELLNAIDLISNLFVVPAKCVLHHLAYLAASKFFRTVSLTSANFNHITDG